MNESLQDAKEELKRIDHLIYVTLKYTRTVDVFLSIIERMINSYEFIMDVLLDIAVKEKKIKDKPDIPLAKSQAVLDNFESENIKSNVEKYLVFRKLRRAKYEKRNEFRRHVTMSSLIDGQVVEVNIDNITEDYHNLHSFIEFIQKMMEE